MCERKYFKGERGKRGHRGPTGIQGISGIPGVQGPTGPQGEQGEIGIQGFQGPTGPQGEIGEIGIQGPTGPQGEIGIRGEKGEQGIQGPSGDTGPPGPAANAGGNAPHTNMQPYLAVNFIINVDGSFPNPNVILATPYLGEVRLMAGSIVPKGWMICDGAILSKNDYFLLFGVIGNMFGGDAITTFALPDFRSRVPIHNSPNYSIGQSGGVETVTLSVAQLAIHNHS